MTNDIGPLVAGAIGDSYGAGFEFTTQTFINQNNLMRDYVQHPKWDTLPGNYTDDTQMQMALAELMLNPKVIWNHYHIAAAFFEVFKRDPRKGYAGPFYEFLKGCTERDDFQRFLYNMRPHSQKVGGAMRAGVIGLIPDMDAVINLAMLQASVTHATKIGMESAVASALITHYFHYKVGPKGFLSDWLTDEGLDYSWGAPHLGRVARISRSGHVPVWDAVQVIMKHDSMTAILRDCVARGGDTDTCATIALTAASRSVEVEQNLSIDLINGLEDDEWGYSHLEKLDRALLKKFPRDGKQPD